MHIYRGSGHPEGVYQTQTLGAKDISGLGSLIR